MVLVLDHFPQLLAVHGRGNLFRGVRHGQAVGGQGFLVVLHADGIHHDFPVGARVRHLRHLCQNLLGLLGRQAELGQLRAVNIDGDFRVGAGEGGADAVRQRIADHGAGAGNIVNALLDGGAQFLLVLLQVYAHEQFGGADGFRVFVVFRASRALGDAENARNAFNVLHHRSGDALRFIQGSARHRADEDRVAVLVERRQEAGSEGGPQPQGQQRDGRHDGADRLGEAQAEFKNGRINALDEAGAEGVPAFQRGGVFALLEPHVAEHRGNGDGYDEGGEQGQHVGDAQGAEELAFQPGQEEDRREHQQDDDGGEGDGTHDFPLGLHQHLILALAPVLRQGGVPVQVPPGYFHENDGVVHHVPHGYGQAAQGHDVDGQPEDGEHHHPEQDGQGHGNQRDDGRAQVQQRQEDDDHDHRSRNEQGLRAVVQGHFNEIRLAVGGGVQFHALGKLTLAELLDGCVHSLRQGQRIGSRHLLHGKHHGVFPHEPGVAPSRRAVYLDLRYVLKPENAGGVVRNQGAVQLFNIGGAGILLNGELLPGHVLQVPGGHGRLGFLNGRFQAGKVHPCQLELVGIVNHLVFRQAAAQHRDLSYAGDGQQARAQLVFRQLPHVQRGGVLVPRQGDQHDFPRYGDDGRQLRGRAFRQGLSDRAQAFRYDLARLVDILVPVKVHPYEGEAAAGGGAHALDPGGAVHGGLNGNGDILLHFLSGEAGGFRLDGDARNLQFRKHVHGNIFHHENADDRQRERQQNHGNPVIQAE